MPISVEPRAHAKRMSLHPPRENSEEEVPVPPRSWRTSTGFAAARAARAVTRTEVWKYMVVWRWEVVSLWEGCGLKWECWSGGLKIEANE